ncbi:MAG TPA: hypothetical protein VD929_01675 [Caulobacteraceae bacterium]|nr:hypothetical protein [Caulobacteraceae bacterium]
MPFSLSPTLFLASIVFSLLLCVHVVRSKRELYWLFIILIFQPLGGLVYFVAIMLPEILRGPTARRLGETARETLDPGRDYRTAKAAYEDTPSVQNTMKLAEAAMALEKWDEADGLYAVAMQGLYAEDPALMVGRAHALLELQRPAEALGLLDQARGFGDAGVSPQAALARARALHALDRRMEAEGAYLDAVARLPGLEAPARYAVFLAETERKDQARDTLAEIDKRMAKTPGPFRKEAKTWRDHAAERIG